MALKAEELRIGNMVEIYVGRATPWAEPFMQEAVTIKTLTMLDRFPERGRGIPLTPEWLERAGFESRQREHSHNGGRSLIWELEDVAIEQADNKYYLWIGVGGDDYYSGRGIEIEHVHHLQNLAHALTGQELNFTANSTERRPENIGGK